MTLKELDLPRRLPATVGLSGSESELDLVVLSGGALAMPMPEPRRLPGPPPPADDTAAFICATSWAEQKLMLLLRREL